MTDTTVVDDTVAMDDNNSVAPDDVQTDAEAPRVPENLASNPILGDIVNRYLATYDKISAYNEAVLAEKDSEWPTTKIVEKARTLAAPTEKGVKPNTAIKKAIDQWEKLVTEVNHAKRNVLELTAKEIGITLNASATRDMDEEVKLKDERKIAHTIGTQLAALAELTNTPGVADDVRDFLSNFELPVVGRNQSTSFTSENTATPKHRVTVKVYKDGTELLSADGFTKTALALSKPQFGYERGKSLKSEDLRKVWEDAGNTSGNVTKPEVEFEDNGLHYVITKK